MFHKKCNRKIEELEKIIRKQQGEISYEKLQPSMANLMRDSLGLTRLDFANVDQEGMPPHYLAGLTEEGRKNFIAELESIYSNERFQTVVSYVINVIGNHSIQKAPEDKMRNGRIGIIGIRTLMSEFSNAHSEFLESKKQPDEFDDQEILAN